MTIHVKFFASLREKTGINDIHIDTVSTVEEAWNTATKSADRAPNTLVAINLDYAQFDDSLKSGDEVAFFPPVTGG